MNNNSSKYVVYMLRPPQPVIFGETYAICTGTEISPGKYRAEYFILMQRPTETLHIGPPIIFDGQTFPPGLDAIDMNFAIDEANRQAEIDLLQLLESRAAELQRPELAYLPLGLEPRPSSLMGCWMRGLFSKQIPAIIESTKCPQLAFYLRLLKQNIAGSLRR